MYTERKLFDLRKNTFVNLNSFCISCYDLEHEQQCDQTKCCLNDQGKLIVAKSVRTFNLSVKK